MHEISLDPLAEERRNAHGRGTAGRSCRPENIDDRIGAAEISQALGQARGLQDIQIAEKRQSLDGRVNGPTSAEQLSQINEYELAVPGELLVCALAVEQDLDAVFAGKPGHAVLRIRTGPAHRLLLMPDPLIELLTETLAAGGSEARLTSSGPDHLVHVRALVDALARKGGTEGVLTSRAGGVASAQEGVHCANDRRRVETTAQAGPYRDIRTQMERDRLLELLSEAARIVFSSMAVQGELVADGQIPVSFDLQAGGPAPGQAVSGRETADPLDHRRARLVIEEVPGEIVSGQTDARSTRRNEGKERL